MPERRHDLLGRLARLIRLQDGQQILPNVRRNAKGAIQSEGMLTGIEGRPCSPH
jgi:hypothetical protein